MEGKSVRCLVDWSAVGVLTRMAICAFLAFLMT